MPAWGKRIAALLGGKPAPKKTAKRSPSVSKTYVPPSDRAALIKAAMEVYRARRGEIGNLLDRAIREMRENPPKTASEHDKLVRILELRRAHVAMKSHLSHSLRRHLVLANLRGLMEERQSPAAAKAPRPPAASRRTVTKR
ncbi:MAG: hypothetical protein RLN70_12765 [Rhodospirillaceae bacterium]